MEKKKNENKEEFERFEGAMLDFISEDSTSAEEVLREYGLDPEHEGQEGLKMIKRLLFLTQAQEEKALNEKGIHQGINKMKRLMEDIMGKSGMALRSIISERSPSFQFRNFKEIDDDGIRDIILDLDLLSILETLEEEE